MRCSSATTPARRQAFTPHWGCAAIHNRCTACPKEVPHKAVELAPGAAVRLHCAALCDHLSTRPLLRRMRAFSSGLVGLWSYVSSTASMAPFLLSRPSTPRESPTHAVVSVRPYSNNSNGIA
jgi:hypothetical protein